MSTKWWAGRNGLVLAALAVAAVVVLAGFQVSRWRAGPPPSPAKPSVSEKPRDAALPVPRSTGPTQSPPPPAEGATAAELAQAPPAPSPGEAAEPPPTAPSPAIGISSIKCF